MAPRTEEPICEVREEFERCVPKIKSNTRYRASFIVKFLLLHVYLLYMVAFKLHYIKFWTYVYAMTLAWMGILGTTAGAHRLWTHRSYTAKWPLRLFLMFCYSTTCLVSLYSWVVNHRLHHKFSDTDLDPHNSRRGFFFSHAGWLMVHKTPECEKEVKKIDMSDVVNDPIANFHTRFFFPISIVQFFILSPLIPVLAWGEDLHLSFMAASILRTVICSHIIGSVNSINHKFGFKPYNKEIPPTELPFMSFFTLGESWHNFHHTFPWDYKAGEFGDRLNWTTRFLDLCGKVGLASEFKTTSPDMIAKIKSNST